MTDVSLNGLMGLNIWVEFFDILMQMFHVTVVVKSLHSPEKNMYIMEVFASNDFYSSNMYVMNEWKTYYIVTNNIHKVLFNNEWLKISRLYIH